MRLGVDITVIAKLLQLDYATIILYCKQTSIKTNLLHIALENERLIFAWLWPYLYTKERKSLHYWTTPILSCAHLSTTYYTPTLFNYYLTVFLLSPCYKLWFQDSWLVFEFSPLLLLAIIFELPLLFLILVYYLLLVWKIIILQHHHPVPALLKKFVIRTHKHLYTRASPFYNHIVVCCAPHR